MITANGYSKDQGIIPEGIAITFGKEMMIEQGGVKNFLTNFNYYMACYDEGDYWMHRCKNLPSKEVDVIYIIVLNRLYAKVYNGGYHKHNPHFPITGLSADGKQKEIDWNYIALSGPMELCPFKRMLKGFQGFRYTTKLF